MFLIRLYNISKNEAAKIAFYKLQKTLKLKNKTLNSLFFIF